MFDGQAERAFREVDKVKQELLAGGIRFAQDVEVMIEIVEGLGEAEGVLRHHRRLFRGDGLVYDYLQLAGEQR